MSKPVKYCVECGSFHRGNKDRCQKCIRYEKSGGEINDLPKEGIIEYDTRGLPICHVCGKAFANLNHHAFQAHGIRHFEYREKFKIKKECKLVSQELSKKHSENYYKKRG